MVKLVIWLIVLMFASAATLFYAIYIESFILGAISFIVMMFLSAVLGILEYIQKFRKKDN
ncbi:MAG: hypothetical protein WCY75_06950 [Sulfurimonadaceae bacterium]